MNGLKRKATEPKTQVRNDFVSTTTYTSKSIALPPAPTKTAEGKPVRRSERKRTESSVKMALPDDDGSDEEEDSNFGEEPEEGISCLIFILIVQVLTMLNQSQIKIAMRTLKMKVKKMMMTVMMRKMQTSQYQKKKLMLCPKKIWKLHKIITFSFFSDKRNTHFTDILSGEDEKDRVLFLCFP
jgi:hypothetical protein